MARIPEGVIFSASGTRGIVGEGLTPEFLVQLGMAYGTWIREKIGGGDPSILIGRDTRPSGPMIHSGMVHALLATGCNVWDAGICATPAILHARMHSTTQFNGAIIISASHNPAMYNGLKFLSPHPPGTFLGSDELDEMKTCILEPNHFHSARWDQPKKVRKHDALNPYLDAILSFIKPYLSKKPELKIAVDTGAGAGNTSTIPLLEKLGCDVIKVNGELLDNPPFFPRDSEPIAKNLDLLSRTVLSENAHLGIALDCDADRISLCDENGMILREDVSLALIMNNIGAISGKQKPLVIVTNVASSLVFEDIATTTGGEIIRTPVGERYLAIKLHQLVETQATANGKTVIGGEGSCGGVILPRINLARDATVAAACIVAILELRGKSLSTLASELNTYHLEKMMVDLGDANPRDVMDALASTHEKSSFKRILNDLRFSGDGWWVLIHPSNTEPVIRILVESRDPSHAKELLKRHERHVRDAL